MVERHLAKVNVASSNLVFRSNIRTRLCADFLFPAKKYVVKIFAVLYNSLQGGVFHG